MECPVAIVIKEVRGGDLLLSDDSRLIKIGGNEFVFDDINGYIIMRKIELARFELGMPDLSTCEKKWQSMTDRLRADDGSVDNYRQLYRKIMIQSGFTGHKYIFTQFMQLEELVKKIEELICLRAQVASKNKQSINISCPDLALPTIEGVDLYNAVIYNPHVLGNAANAIIDYLNKLEVNSFTTDPATVLIKPVEDFTFTLDFDTIIDLPTINSEQSTDWLIAMHNLLDTELVVAQYALEVEKYHCKVINQLNTGYEKCQKIINNVAK